MMRVGAKVILTTVVGLLAVRLLIVILRARAAVREGYAFEWQGAVILATLCIACVSSWIAYRAKRGRSRKIAVAASWSMWAMFVLLLFFLPHPIYD